MLRKYLWKDLDEFKEKYINNEEFRKECWEKINEVEPGQKKMTYEEYKSYTIEWLEKLEEIQKITERIEISIYFVIIIITIAVIRYYKKRKKVK